MYEKPPLSYQVDPLVDREQQIQKKEIKNPITIFSRENPFRSQIMTHDFCRLKYLILIISTMGLCEYQ